MRTESAGDWGRHSADMPDMCHDGCVIADPHDSGMYYPYRWGDGVAHYECRAGHRWTCGWGHTWGGTDPTSRGRDQCGVRRPLRPLDPDTFRGDMRQVVRWHLLMSEADELTRERGLGLAPVWGAIRRGDYDRARSLLDHVRETSA